MADIDAPLAWRMQQDGYLMQINKLRDEKSTLEQCIDELRMEVELLKNREQILITILLNDCDIEVSWDEVRKFWYVGLTENGCLMRDRVCKAEADNDKLRELFSSYWKAVHSPVTPNVPRNYLAEMQALGVKVD